MKRVHVSEIKGPKWRGRPVAKWKNTVKEYTCMKEVLIEMEGLNKQGGSIWIRRGGDSSAVVEALDYRYRYIQIELRIAY